MKVSLAISIESNLWRGLPRARALARETVAACVAEGEIAVREGAAVSLCLADDARLHALNLRWRGMDKPTNVLSFPSAPRALVDAVADRVSRAQRARLQPAVAPKSAPIATLGDIALAYETLKREAEELDVPLADHYRRLIAHGFLHLIGYDHQTDEEAERMEALETRILARVGAAHPYAREAVDE
jgi:probable rRNA maturation factor